MAPEKQPAKKSPFDSDGESRKSQWGFPRLRFGTGTLLLGMLVAGVTAAVGHYLYQANSTNRGDTKVVFVFLLLASPVLLLVAVRIGRWAMLGEEEDE